MIHELINLKIIAFYNQCCKTQIKQKVLIWGVVGCWELQPKFCILKDLKPDSLPLSF